jgi:alanine dehydrogenase
MPKNVRTLMSNIQNIREQVQQADLVIGAVLVAGEKAPTLVSRKLVARMKRGAVIVDVAIDQGGCIETSRPTTHDEPTYLVYDVVHYCVTNMPSAVAGTSTPALTNATFPYVLQLANKGWQRATKENPALAAGLSIVEGGVHDRRIAELFRLPLDRAGAD